MNYYRRNADEIHGDQLLRELERAVEISSDDKELRQQLLRAQERMGLRDLKADLRRLTDTSAAKAALRARFGGRGKVIPPDAQGEAIIEGFVFILYPTSVGRSSHRLFLDCPYCEREIPFGRIRQHFYSASHGGKFARPNPDNWGVIRRGSKYLPYSLEWAVLSCDKFITNFNYSREEATALAAEINKKRVKD
jgi:hypothetical protein